MIIIKATASDLTEKILGEIERIMNEGFKEEGDAWRFCPETFEAFWSPMLSSGVGIMFLLTDEDGVVRGVITGYVNQNPLTNEFMAASINWRLSRSVKGQGWGWKLLKEFEGWAKERGAKWLCSHCPTTNPKMSRALSREYKTVGTVFMKSLP